MKLRKFYPRQVLRTLEGRTFASLSAVEHAAFIYFMRRARKLGQFICVAFPPSDVTALKNASEAERAAVMNNCNTRIFLKMPAAGSDVRIIDAAPGSKRMAELLGGAAIQFDPANTVVLNPFAASAA
jgi:hypothetical protein